MKKQNVLILSFFLCVFLFQNILKADEGMWMPHQMKMLNLQEQGLQMSPDDLYKPDGTGLMSAVVDLGGGTGSFISDKGLIFTNHHVAFGALQRASDPENNYLKNGFLAKNFSEEIQAPGSTAGVLLFYTDISEKINSELSDKMSPKEKYTVVDRIKKQLIADAEKEGPDLFAEIASMYAGNQYYIFVYKRIKDVRIVYAPPRDLGNFGGEVDNWMWPRHTCDFSFLRAYVSPAGVGVEYSPDNVPYEPKVHFKVAEQGVKDGDFTFIMGYPGRTYRNYSTAEAQFDIEKIKYSIKERLELIEFFENASAKSTGIEIKYASMLKGLYNGLKNYRGKLEGFEKAGMIQRKQEMDNKFEEWISQDQQNRNSYSGIIQKISDYLNNEYKDFYWKESQIRNLTYYRGGALLTQAHRIARNAIESQKPDMERDSYYQDRNHSRLVNSIKLAERSYDFDVDKEYTILLLNKLLQKTKNNTPRFLQKIAHSEGGIKNWTDESFKKTKMNDSAYRLNLLDKSVADLKVLNDPLLDFAFSIEKELAELREQKLIMNQKLKDLKKIYLDAMLVMNDNKMAPDANSTIRFTYGPVKGYSPRDGVYYKPLTTLKGVLEKDTGEEPFIVPDKLKELYKKKDFGRYVDRQLAEVPACFLNTTNVTGGNSGSPTINAKGEVTGIVFDMTYESVIGDYYIIPDLQRVISVDIRYVLFVTDKFSNASHLIEEMGIESETPSM